MFVAPNAATAAAAAALWSWGYSVLLGYLALHMNGSTGASFTVAFDDVSHFIDGEIEAQGATCTKVRKLQTGRVCHLGF